MDDYDDDDNILLRSIFAHEELFSILQFVLLGLKFNLHSEQWNRDKVKRRDIQKKLTLDFFDSHRASRELQKF